jgi:hypothetical protein
MRDWSRGRGYGLTEVYSRNSTPLFFDVGPGPKYIRVYSSNPIDAARGRKVLIQGMDTTGQTLLTPEGVFQAQGACLTIAQPFSQLSTQVHWINGIQKNVTSGTVTFTQVDPVTGQEDFLLSMEPSEEVAGYRRYYFHNLPRNCFGLLTGSGDHVIVNAMAKLELIPVRADSDYCLIQNQEALLEECEAIRYSRMDSAAAKQMSRDRHQMAISLLNGELTHMYGKNHPAVNFKPFGSATLERVKMNMV